MSTNGNGPGPSGYQTRPFSGNESNPNPQYRLRDRSSSGVGAFASLLKSTRLVRIVTESRNSRRWRSVPLP